MMSLLARTAAQAIVVLGVTSAQASRAGDWTKPVEVRHETDVCVSYRARLSGDYLVVQATLEPGWHTFAMDNKRRAEEKLAGKRSLGIERSTEIEVSAGLAVAGPWYQTPPADASKPELNWFTWIFREQALFVAKVRRSGAQAAQIAVRGQACTESSCKNIDVEISLPLAGANAGGGPSAIDLKALVQVR
jgi:hypothetical protein